MKRFLYFALSLFLIYLGLILGTKIVWAFYLPRTLERDFIPSDVHTIVIGASNGECSWDDSIIKGTKNRCSSGYTNLDTYYELKYCLEYNNTKIDTVVLSLSILNFLLYEDDRLHRESTIISSEPRSLLDYGKFFDTYHCCVNYYKSQICSTRWIETFKNSPYSDGFLRLQRDKMANPNFDDINKALVRIDGKDGFTSDYIRKNCSLQVKWLEAIRDLCLENNITIIIYSAPVYKILEMVNDRGFYELLSEVLPAETLVADYSRFAMPDSSYYGDPTHLNYKGAQFFSQEIAEHGISYRPLILYTYE